MRIPRIFHPGPLSAHTQVELDKDALRYTIQVLRLRQGAPLVLFNGAGGEYEAHLLSVTKHQAIVTIGRYSEPDTESPLYTHLVIGISKGDRMDFGIQKAVELGVTEITPLLSEHCVIRLDNKREAKRLQHWQGVLQSACEQSGRNRLPVLNTITPLSEWLACQRSARTLILAPQSTARLGSLEADQNGFALMIGPEGGFSQAEIEQSVDAGCSAIKLGPRILRTETAVVTALTAVQTLWGDLRG